MSKVREKQKQRQKDLSEFDVKFEKIIQFSGWMFLFALTVLMGGWFLLDNILEIIDLSLNAITFSLIIFIGTNSAVSFALASKIIANQKKYELAESAYIAGLLHDSGKLILDSYIRERGAVFTKYIKVDGMSLSKAENMLFGFDHAEIAAKVCERWNFPQPIHNAIKFHHSPFNIANKELACIIYVADEIAKLYGKDTEAMIIEIDDTAKKILDIEDNEIEWFMHEMIASVEQITGEIENSIPKYYI